jgi:NADH-ubiquinone oxidoreductase chain 1
VFLIGGIAETNRAPFDLAEAESELVSGFMTEHAAVIFVFFFLAEYASIVLICILISILFFGGYLLNIVDLVRYFNIEEIYFYNNKSVFQFFIEGLSNGVLLGIKTSIMVFTFI